RPSRPRPGRPPPGARPPARAAAGSTPPWSRRTRRRRSSRSGRRTPRRRPSSRGSPGPRTRAAPSPASAGAGRRAAPAAADPGPRSRPASSERGQGPRDDQALDLGGALEEGVDLGVAVPLLDREVADVTVAAADLDRLLGHLHGHLSGLQLGHRAFGLLELAARAAFPERPPDQAPGGLDLGRHAGQW